MNILDEIYQEHNISDVVMSTEDTLVNKRVFRGTKEYKDVLYTSRWGTGGTVQWYHLTHDRVAVIKKTNENKCW